MKKGFPFPLGVSVKENYINFAIAVPSGKTCILKLYKKNQEHSEMEVELLEEDTTGEVRCVALPKSQVKGLEYLYLIDGDTCVDPYAKSVVEQDGVVTRGRIFLDSYDWEGDKPLEIPPHEVIAYSLHVRGFTKHSSSLVKKKGTFQGVIEKIPYLKELGVNQIQCMPVYSFEESKYYKNYWGYGNAFCFAVKSNYAAGKNAEKELKDMVKACHKTGIEVVLHLPFYHEIPKTLMLECLRYYVMEYHVDGFVLDPFVAPMDCIMTDPYLKKVKILKHSDDFQTIMRRFLRGDEGMVEGVIEWLNKPMDESMSCNYITRHTGFTLADLVTYEKKHNEANGEFNQDGPAENYSWNCGKEGRTKNPDVLALRRKQIRNALALMFFAQGIPCVLAGDEFGNSQNGNNNVYCQDNETAWLNWNQLKKDHTLHDYVKGLVELRKNYLFPTKGKKYIGKDSDNCGVPDISYHGDNAWVPPIHKKSKKLGIYYHNEGEIMEDCLIAYNMDDKVQNFALPDIKNGKNWYRVFSTEQEMFEIQEELEKNQKQATLKERTIEMFIGR